MLSRKFLTICRQSQTTARTSRLRPRLHSTPNDRLPRTWSFCRLCVSPSTRWCFGAAGERSVTRIQVGDVLSRRRKVRTLVVLFESFAAGVRQKKNKTQKKSFMTWQDCQYSLVRNPKSKRVTQRNFIREVCYVCTSFPAVTVETEREGGY